MDGSPSSSMNETWNSQQFDSPGMDRTLSDTDHSFSSGGSWSPGVHSPPQQSPYQVDRTFSSPEDMSPSHQLDVTYSPGTDHSNSGAYQSFSSVGSYPGMHSPPAASTPQQGPHQMDRTFSSPEDRSSSFSPQRGSSPRMDRTSSPQSSSSPRTGEYIPPGGWKTWTNVPRSSEMDRSMSDGSFTDRTLSNPGSGRFSYSDELDYDMDESALYDTDESFVDDAFDEGTFPMVLQKVYDPAWGTYRKLVEDRGYYPAEIPAGAERFGTPELFATPKGLASPLRTGEIEWRRPTPLPPSPSELLHSPYYFQGYSPEPLSPYMNYDKLMQYQVDYLKDLQKYLKKIKEPKKTPPSQPPPRAAGGTVRMSPHTPAISEFSRFGYTDPHVKELNLPPEDREQQPGIKKTVTIVSPGRADPLHLNVKVSPKGISQSPSGEHIICDIAVGVEEAVIKPQRYAGYFTPPQTETVRRFDREHGMFTPKSVFKKGHFAVRNIFDASPQTSSPRPPPLNTTIEWEEDYLKRKYGAGPSGAGLNRTFTPPSAGRNALNRTFDAGPSGAGLNRTFTPPSAGRNALNRTFDAGPSGAGLNTTYSGSPEYDRSFGSSSGYEEDGYRTPSYKEPDYPAWTYPTRKKQVVASPEQDLIAAVEDEGFDYYNTPPSRSPRRDYPETN